MRTKEIIMLPVSKMRCLSICAVLTVCIAVLLASCGSKGAEKQVAADLDALRESGITASGDAGFRGALDRLGAGGSDYDDFMTKVRDFDYEIIASEEDPEAAQDAENDKDSDEAVTVVEVSIRTYDFGKAYIASWADYLEQKGDAASNNDEDFDEAGFYSILFSNLSGLEDKDYIRTVKIKAADPKGSGEWITDVKKNRKLRDAIFGGMISEMEALSG